MVQLVGEPQNPLLDFSYLIYFMLLWNMVFIKENQLFEHLIGIKNQANKVNIITSHKIKLFRTEGPQSQAFKLISCFSSRAQT